MKKITAILISILTVVCLIVPVNAYGDSTETVASDAFEIFEGADALLTVDTAAQFNISAKAWLLMDRNTGTVLAAHNEHQRLYPASVTKIMSLLLFSEALDSGKLSYDMTVTCSDTAAAKGGSQIWLEPGETMTVRELMKAIAVYSANDACALLGETVAGSEKAFVDMMNERAASLGMNDTQFDNCTGLDDDTETHLTSAYDVALMSRELMKHSAVRDFSTIWMDELRGGKTQLVNTNKLIRTYKGATGLKTGTTTKAGCCISATAQRDGLELIAVILGAPSGKERFAYAKELLDYGFAKYEIYTAEPKLTGEERVKVTHGVESEITVKAGKSGEMLIDKGGKDKITEKTTLLETVEAPVSAGDVVGKTEYFSGETKIGESAVISAQNIEKMTLANALTCIFGAFAKK